MFSVLSNYETSVVDLTIDLEILENLIRFNTRKDVIEKLHTLKKGCPEYNQIKSKLRCIKPHATFKDVGKTEFVEHLSGYLFFDIDDCDVESYKAKLLEKHSDKICMCGKTVGGKGVFFYVKLANASYLTVDNFLNVQNYVKDIVFKGEPIDNWAKGITRNQVIPYDANLYVNHKATFKVPSEVFKNKKASSKEVKINKKLDDKKGARQCIKTREKGYTPACTLTIPIKDFYHKIIWCTPVEVYHPIIDKNLLSM